MLGISYGELFLMLGATAALIGPKDLPMIARTAGRLAGRAIGYVQMARGHFENVLQQSQASQVHKELQDTMAQLEAIRYEIRSLSIMNPGPMTRRLMDGVEHAPSTSGSNTAEKLVEEKKTTGSISEDHSATTIISATMHSQAMTYAKLAESATLKTASLKAGGVNLNDDDGLFTVLPVSAESTGLLPNRRDEVKGSDIMLEAIVEAEIAHKAKDFFAQPQNQINVNDKA
ncbi:hypothetical protein MRB53_020421 [Persea americana]|uniref:Uncharacterized protein n=1 Tax=Persea americana TaxID=3435 RepID=A0ACC2L0X2_PERAE|nr:hypothetical protein MRB53_020421 [Persea americana]|eukprot:TRINITY_DN24686_c0_g1_i2.p1 TRINITY_DN24686_c0_g1~~TRINITY_DN24686_c0_g1_i2.p1  ORF type:complete len:230 (-),score=45.02 TRINITY_DN24686_c0_g1_i2:511-1200(-)